MSRKNPTPIAKPEVVFLNAYRDAAKLRSLGYDKDLKLGDCLAQLDDREAQYLWRDFIVSMDNKFFEKEFSHAALWQACLDHKVNPLHITHSIAHGQILGRNAARPNLVIYQDGVKEQGDLAELYGNLDSLLESALAFEAPYEKDVWFGQLKPADLGREWIRLMSRDVGYGLAMLQGFLTHSRHAQTFCLTHARDILEHSPDKEKSELLGHIFDSICEVGFDLNRYDDNRLTPTGEGDLFEVVLNLAAERTQPMDQLDEFSSSLFVGRYVKARFASNEDFGRICDALGKTGINEFTGSVALAEFGLPERFMTLASSMSADLARTLFSITAARFLCSYRAEDQFTILNEYDHWFQGSGLGSVLTADMLDRLTTDLSMTKLLAEKGLVDFPSYAEKPYFSQRFFCSRIGGEYGDVFARAGDIKDFVVMCKEVGAKEHILYILDEMLSKPGGETRLQRESDKKVFIEAVLETQVVEPEEVMKTDKRVEKLVAMGVRPDLLGLSRRYAGKWRDASLGSDLGL